MSASIPILKVPPLPLVLIACLEVRTPSENWPTVYSSKPNSAFAKEAVGRGALTYTIVLST